MHQKQLNQAEMQNQKLKQQLALMNEKIDNALQGQGKLQKTPVAAQAKAEPDMTAGFEHQMAIERRVWQLEHQIAQKDAEMEKEKLKYQKMQIQVSNIDAF